MVALLTFHTLAQQFINALGVGSSYALLALGLAMVFSVLGMVNFAHGELVTVSAYTVYLLDQQGIPFWAQVPIAILASTVTALLMERLAFRPLRNAGFITLLFTSFALSTIIRNLFLRFVAARELAAPVPNFFAQYQILGGYSVGNTTLVTAGSALIAVVLLTLFLQRSRHGVAMLAASQDFQIARAMGVRANRVIALAFAISGALAGLAGIFVVATRGTVDPTMGFDPVLVAFICTVIGGLGSLPGAVIGGFVYAFIQGFLFVVLPNGAIAYQDVFALAIVIVILYFRPGGLLAARDVVTS